MAKLVYSWFIATDKNIPDTVVRSSTIPEELGRVSYLLSDKTGTLTQNEMVFKKLHLGTVSFGQDSMEEVRTYLYSVYTNPAKSAVTASKKTVSSFLHFLYSFTFYLSKYPPYDDISDGISTLFKSTFLLRLFA